MPLSRSIRIYIEGEIYPPTPYDPYSRWIIPKPWHLPLEDILIFTMLTVIISLIEVIVIRRVIANVAQFFDLHSKDYARFKESFWQFCFYTPAWILECFIVYDKPFFYEPCLVWEPPFPRQLMDTSIFWLYAFQIAWYMHCTIFHVFVDARKSDFWPMLLHHFVTLLLLICAYTSGYYRVGILCLFCLDICDIFLHASKTIRLIENVRPLNPVFIVTAYIGMVLSWFFFRLVLFPVKVIYTSLVQSIDYGGWINADNWFFFNVLLFIIFVLQVYWFGLILKSGYKFIRYGEELDDHRDPSAIKKQQ